MKSRIGLMLVLLAVCARADDAKLTFKKAGKETASATIEELKKKAAPKAVEVFEFQNETKRTYLAIPFNAVLDQVYGKDWRKGDDVLFTCADGYQPVVPVSEFTKHEAYLAFALENGEPFTVLSKIHKNETVQLGPLYLIWKNVGNATLMAQGPSYWPFQLVGMDLVSFSEKFPKIAPPKGSSADAKAGFALFRRTCFACHTVNGDGGQTSGVELIRPVSVTKYIHRDWLPKWIENPSAVREGAKMPAYEQESGYKLPPAVRTQQIKQIIAYLEAMSSKK